MADKQLDACISEVVRKFQATANVRFQLKERQVTAVKSLLLHAPAFSVTCVIDVFRRAMQTAERPFYCENGNCSCY